MPKCETLVKEASGGSDTHISGFGAGVRGGRRAFDDAWGLTRHGQVSAVARDPILGVFSVFFLVHADIIYYHSRADVIY